MKQDEGRWRGLLSRQPLCCATAVSMVWMIVPWSVSNDDVRIPLADQSGNYAAILKRGFEFAVMDVEDFTGNAQAFGNESRFSRATFGERTAGHLPVTNVTIGN